MTTSELIIRGILVGAVLFSVARAIYLNAYAKGFKEGSEYVLDKIKQ